MTTVAIHQPQYLPWLPYFDKMDRCDIFIYLDNVQYQKNGYQNRNQIQTAQGPAWLTVPVHASLDWTIACTKIAGVSWKDKHLRTLDQAYARAPFRQLLKKELRPILEQPWEDLADLNIAVTEWLATQLRITCRRLRASQLAAAGQGEHLVIDLCRAVGATDYLSGIGAATYQNERHFEAAGLQLRYQEYQHVPYPQCHAARGFASGLAALDLVLNTGPAARTHLLAGRTIQPLARGA